MFNFQFDQIIPCALHLMMGIVRLLLNRIIAATSEDVGFANAIAANNVRKTCKDEITETRIFKNFAATP